MSTNSIPLAYNQWYIADNDTLVAWLDGVVFFDIRPAESGDTLELRINDAARCSTCYLGDYDSVGQAIVWARRYLEGNES